MCAVISKWLHGIYLAGIDGALLRLHVEFRDTYFIFPVRMVGKCIDLM